LKTRYLVLAGAFSALFLAFVVHSQTSTSFQIPPMKGYWNPVVGAGADYEIHTLGGPAKHVEWAIVGTESVEGKDGYWIEMSAPDGGGSSTGLVTKSLMLFDGRKLTMQKTVFQAPGRPPMEMALETPERRSGNSPVMDVRKDARDLGKETITTAAGSFACEHYRSSDGGDVWVSPQVSPFGVVKSQGKVNTMVLVKTIADAKDKITGTPQPFNPKEMMPQKLPQQQPPPQQQQPPSPRL
jgi:hypothetical protein